jgi:hypothetical protein
MVNRTDDRPSGETTQSGKGRTYPRPGTVFLLATLVIATVTGWTGAQAAGQITSRGPIRPIRTIADDTAGFGPGRHMMQAIGKVVRAGNAASERVSGRMGWYDNVSVLGSFVQPGRRSSFTLPLNAGDSYAFVGGGDDDAEDVDIAIADDRGVVVAKDSAADANPVVFYRAPRTATYTVTLHLYDARVASFLALAVLTDGASRYSVPLENVVTAMAMSLVQAAAIERTRGGARYHESDNQWAIFGQVVRPGQSMRIVNLTMDERVHSIAAAGDGSSQDLDLFFRRDGRLLVADQDADSIPVVNYRTPGGGGYEFEVKNLTASGPTMVVATILD